MRLFHDVFQPERGKRILDVGGTHQTWLLVDIAPDVTLLNIDPSGSNTDLPANLHYEQGDGTRLPYPDGAFDICFSNSTIEHVHSWKRQQAFASEMRRVAREIWLQTPAREFFIEPHWIAPFIHWLPKARQRQLARNFTIYGLVFRPTSARVRELVDEFRLLSYAELVELFPDCEIWRERFLGMTKSYIVVRRV